MMLPRASNAGRWVNCAASPRMEQAHPDDPSEDAKEGTAAHWLAQQVLGGYVSCVEELTDRTTPNGVIISGEMVEHTQAYIDTVRAVTTTPVIERTMPIMDGVEPGTPDALYVGADGHAHIWDLKYGYGIVEAPGNWQLACYMVGLFTKHPNLVSVTGVIVQPRPFHPDGRVRSWTVSNAEVVLLRHQLAMAAQATQSPAAQTVSGQHCNYCRALHVCEAARRAAMNGVDVALQSQAVDMPPDGLAGELRTLRRAVNAIKLRLDSIEAHATAEIDLGVIIPGFELDRSFGRRRWVNDEVVTVLEAITGQELTQRTPMSPAATERAGVDTTLVAQFTTTPETGRKLVERDNGAKARAVFK